MKWAASMLIFSVAVLIGLGMVMLYSSSMNMDVAQKKQKSGGGAAAVANQAGLKPGTNLEQDKPSVGTHYLVSQFEWFLLGLVCCVLAASMDYRRLKTLTPWLLGLSVVLLLLVFVPFLGHPINGARRWIWRPGLPHFQSSELAKMALILFLAAYADRYQRQMAGFKMGLVIPGMIIALVLGLIFMEPDRGCTILLAAVCGVMLFVAGSRLSYLIPPAALLAGGLAFSFRHDAMRMGRIMAWLHPEQSKDGAGYQVREAIIALGSGGWFGLGLGNGRQKLGFVPEHHTDFIFSIIGEELGLVATLSVVLLFILLVFCGIFIARRSCDAFGLLLGTGLTFMIGFQAFVNIGVVTGVLPNKGMPLPFISYGGSNLVLMLASVGLLISIARFTTEAVTQKSSNPFEVALEPSHA
jgi:cell division protein FtsW